VGHLVPGVEASADPVMQARLFSYSDTQRYRLGVNYQQLPVNRPLHSTSFQRDGAGTVFNPGSKPNYPSSFKPLAYKPVKPNHSEHWEGPALTTEFELTDEDFVQPNMLWEVLGRQEGEQEHLVYNISSHLKGAIPDVRRSTYEMFTRVNPELGRRLEAATEGAVQALPKSARERRAAVGKAA